MHYAWHTSSLRLSKHFLLQPGCHAERRHSRHLEGGLPVTPQWKRQWRVPHFEKMLYDNALIARLLLIFSNGQKAQIQEGLLDTFVFGNLPSPTRRGFTPPSTPIREGLEGATIPGMPESSGPRR